MNIRRATPEDKSELCRLLVEFDLETGKRLSDHQALVRRHRDPEHNADVVVTKYFSQPNYVVFVAEEGALLAGFVSGELKTKANRVLDREGYIEGWYMSEEFRGHAVGGQLFDRIVDYFAKADCTHLALDTHLANTKAIDIYEHMGFEKRLVTFFKLLK